MRIICRRFHYYTTLCNRNTTLLSDDKFASNPRTFYFRNPIQRFFYIRKPFHTRDSLALDAIPIWLTSLPIRYSRCGGFPYVLCSMRLYIRLCIRGRIRHKHVIIDIIIALGELGVSLIIVGVLWANSGEVVYLCCHVVCWCVCIRAYMCMHTYMFVICAYVCICVRMYVFVVFWASMCFVCVWVHVHTVQCTVFTRTYVHI